MPRWAAGVLCAAQVALSLWIAAGLCGACGGGSWAWAGATFYAVLGIGVFIPRLSSLTGLLIQFALAFHAFLVSELIRSGRSCIPCTVSAGLACALFLSWMPHDSRSPLRGFLEFVPILLLAGAIARGGQAPTAGEVETALHPAEGLELVVFEREECPYCRRFAGEILPDLRRRHPELKVRRLPAGAFPGVRVVPTILLRGPAGRRLFEGLPSKEDLERTLREISGSGQRNPPAGEW